MTLDLPARSGEFAQEVQDRLDAVLPGGEVEERRITLQRHDPWYVVRTGPAEEPKGIRLFAAGEHVGWLDVRYYCAADQSGAHLAVRKSLFEVSSQRDRTPLFRLDYNHAAYQVPAAHWNVHAERGDTSVLLARCNPSHRGLVSGVHLPVGGIRQRPCLEDFLEMLVAEFRIDTNPGWQAVLADGREQWRRRQARALARDAPEEVAAELAALGYEVTPPEDGHRPVNVTMLRCR